LITSLSLLQAVFSLVQIFLPYKYFTKKQLHSMEMAKLITKKNKKPWTSGQD